MTPTARLRGDDEETPDEGRTPFFGPTAEVRPWHDFRLVLDDSDEMKKQKTKKDDPKTVEKGDDAKQSKKRGWDEIESLFDGKKKQKQEIKEKSPKDRKKATVETKATGEWVDDGLGGKYNAEGYTGRVENGIKIFKAHVLYKEESGKTPDCPFDCNCCFI